MVIGIDHGYYAIKTKQVCFPTGIIRYEYEPYTMQNVLQYRGEYYVRNSRSICFGRNSQSVFYMKGNAMKSRLRM